MMRVLFFILAMMAGTLLADDPEFQKMREWSLQEKMDYVGSFTVDERGQSKQWEKGMKALRYHLTERYSMQWAGNADSLKNIRNQVEEIRPLLMELGYSEVESDRFYAVEIGKYLNINQEVENMLYQVLDKSVESSGQSQMSSLDAIFGYGLEKEELKKDLVDGLSTNPEIARKSRFGPVAMGRAGKWALDEAVENLILLLEQKYEQQGNTMHGALKSLKELGPSAKEVLPRLGALYEQRKKDGDADFREIETLEFAIARISKSESADGSRRPPNRALADRPLKSPQKERAEVATSENNEQEAEKKSSLPWIFAGVLLVGILALLLKIFKGKSTS